MCRRSGFHLSGKTVLREIIETESAIILLKHIIYELIRKRDDALNELRAYHLPEGSEWT